MKKIEILPLTSIRFALLEFLYKPQQLAQSVCCKIHLENKITVKLFSTTKLQQYCMNKALIPWAHTFFRSDLAEKTNDKISFNVVRKKQQNIFLKIIIDEFIN